MFFKQNPIFLEFFDSRKKILKKKSQTFKKIVFTKKIYNHINPASCEAGKKNTFSNSFKKLKMFIFM